MDQFNNDHSVIRADAVWELGSHHHAAGGSVHQLDELFKQCPASKVLVPTRYPKQKLSRSVMNPGARWSHRDYFPSHKNQAMIWCESKLELFACQRLETRDDVISYRAQPYPVNLYFHGKYRRVFPDFEFTTEGGRGLIDITSVSKARKEKFKERVNALGFFARRKGMSYDFLTEDDLCAGSRLTNAHLTYDLIRGEAHELLIKEVVSWMRDQGAMSIFQMQAALRNYPQARSVAIWLLYRGVTTLDWDLPIEDQIFRLKETI